MQLRFFTVPCIGGEQIEAELNKFLASKKVLSVDRQVVNYNGTPCWACCVSYLQSSDNFTLESKRSEKVDYKVVLSPESFEKFSRMRVIRKQLAENDAVPSYSVFTDAELAEMTKLNVLDTASLHTIKGIGVKRIEKFGTLFCEAYGRLLQDENKE